MLPTHIIALLGSISGIVIFFMFHIIRKWKEPILYGTGELKHLFLNRSKIVHQKYCPPITCLNPAIQFMVRTKYEKTPPVNIKKGTLNLADGGIVAFDKISLDDESANSDYTIVIVPGLRESTHSVKVLSTANSLLRKGFSNVFVLNYRGACSIPLRSRQMSFPFGEHNHINECVAHLETELPDKKILLVGACLGSMCVIDYLSKSESDRPSVVGAVCHSCNWHLKSESTKIRSGIAYTLFYKRLVEDTKQRIFRTSDENERKLKDEWHKTIDIEKVKKAKSIWDLEEHYVAPMTGISGAEEYYQRVSPTFKCHKVHKPVVIINSRDDFAAPFENIDLDNFQKNPNLLLWSTAAGGHVSFVESLFPVTSYLDRVVPECADLICQYVNEHK